MFWIYLSFIVSKPSHSGATLEKDTWGAGLLKRCIVHANPPWFPEHHVCYAPGLEALHAWQNGGFQNAEWWGGNWLALGELLVRWSSQVARWRQDSASSMKGSLTSKSPLFVINSLSIYFLYFLLSSSDTFVNIHTDPCVCTASFSRMLVPPKLCVLLFLKHIHFPNVMAVLAVIQPTRALVADQSALHVRSFLRKSKMPSLKYYTQVGEYDKYEANTWWRHSEYGVSEKCFATDWTAKAASYFYLDSILIHENDMKVYRR